MKTLLTIFAVFLTPMAIHAVELQSIPHRIIADIRTFIRDATDRRYSVWSDDPAKANQIIKDFGIRQEELFTLQKGDIFVVFLNDRLEEDLVQITYNKTANGTFADYANSGMMFKLNQPGEGKKYSHLTAVVFTPVVTPNHIGLRDMIPNGLSEKK